MIALIVVIHTDRSYRRQPLICPALTQPGPTSILSAPTDLPRPGFVTPPRALSSYAPPSSFILYRFSCNDHREETRSSENSTKAIGIAKERERGVRFRGSLSIASNLAWKRCPDTVAGNQRITRRATIACKCDRVGVYEFVCKPPLDQPRFHYTLYSSTDPPITRELRHVRNLYICTTWKVSIDAVIRAF